MFLAFLMWIDEFERKRNAAQISLKLKCCLKTLYKFIILSNLRWEFPCTIEIESFGWEICKNFFFEYLKEIVSGKFAFWFWSIWFELEGSFFVKIKFFFAWSNLNTQKLLEKHIYLFSFKNSNLHNFVW